MAEKEELKEIKKIFQCVSAGKNFLLSGGAGSGKTYSLVQTIQAIAEQSPSASIACITYTNVAVLEIKHRTNVKNLWVSTIHDFLWINIAKFQKELKKTLIELINDPNSQIKNPMPNEIFDSEFVDGIQYKEYVRIRNGEISHDEVLILANKMYSKYTKLCDILKDKYDYILVDEYQDTSPLVIEILLDFLSKSSKKNIIGFYGDSMQAIYEDGVGDLNKYIENGTVIEVKKEENRRNPLSVINLANKIRTDGICQSSSDDLSAPNMLKGKVVLGSAIFLYGTSSSLDTVKKSQWCNQWDFDDSIITKELRLTHNLIAKEAGFSELMEVYDADPIFKFKSRVQKFIKKEGIEVDPGEAFDAVVSKLQWKYSRGKNKNRSKKEVFLDEAQNERLYEYVKNWPYGKVMKIYLNKDSLIDDKKEMDDVIKREPKRDKLLQQLFAIQHIVQLYQTKQYDQVIRKTSFKLASIKDKAVLNERITKLSSMQNSTIEEVIEYAASTGICPKDERFEEFIASNSYLYWRVKDIHFSVFQNLYKYLEGYVPLSTQHKIKGSEFQNVLVILQNGGWSNYNFEYLLDDTIFESLTPTKKRSYANILKRTQKLFYVCCTRAKRNLVVYCPSPTEMMIEGAKKLFGEQNIHPLD